MVMEHMLHTPEIATYNFSIIKSWVTKGPDLVWMNQETDVTVDRDMRDDVVDQAVVAVGTIW